jgi:hypothetical protein
MGSSGNYPSISSWAEADAWLKRGRNPNQRTIAGKRATQLLRDLDTQIICVMYQQTAVVTYYPDGRIQLNSDGWRTPTTKERINELSPARISAGGGQWFLHAHSANEYYYGGPTSLYYDNMFVLANGDPVDPRPVEEHVSLKAALDKRVRVYLKAYGRYYAEHGRPEVEELLDPQNDLPFRCVACEAGAPNPADHVNAMGRRQNRDLMHGKSEPLGVLHYLLHIVRREYPAVILWHAMQRRGNPYVCYRMFGDLGDHDLRYFFRTLKPLLIAELEEHGWPPDPYDPDPARQPILALNA